MNRFNTLEDILLWKKAHQAILHLYKLTEGELFSRDFALKNQMRRAAISISSNIAEGLDRKSNKEFCHFPTISKASSSELRSQLILAKDLNYVWEREFLQLKQNLIEINKMAAGLIRYLEQKMI